MRLRMSCRVCKEEPLPAQAEQVAVKLTAARVAKSGLLLPGIGPTNSGLVTVPPGEVWVL